MEYGNFEEELLERIEGVLGLNRMIDGMNELRKEGSIGGGCCRKWGGEGKQD